MTSNPFLLAADNSPALLPLLRENLSKASDQDEHGYSLVHAAASYNHLDLLRSLIREFNVDVNIKDEDDETALFVVETVDAARCLVDELGADINVRGSDGVTAREKIESEADFPAVAEYLKSVEEQRRALPRDETSSTTTTNGQTVAAAGAAPPAIDLPPVPNGLAVSVGTVEQAADVPLEVDPEFKRRIEQLAEREDFHMAEGQAELRRLIEDTILDQGLADERNVRQRQE